MAAPRTSKRILRRAGYAALVLFCALLAYTLVVKDPTYQNRTDFSADASGDPRVESRTYTTFPEWYIVYAAQEYADFVKAGGHPTDFPYFASIEQYWDVTDAIIEAAGGAAALDETTLTILNTIGWSFSLESGVIGAYETTIGRIFDYLNFRTKTVEDKYTETIAAEYGDFLVHTPWFGFPYRSSLIGLWQTYGLSSFTPRGLERRLSFTIGYTLKASYGRLINYLTQSSFGGALPYTTLTTKLFDAALLSDLTSVSIIAETPTSTTLRLPRYRAFLAPLRSLAEKGIEFESIEGNRTIMLSTLVQNGTSCDWLTAHEVLTVPSLTEPKDRVLAVTTVPELPNAFNALENCSLTPEHVYDY